METGETGYGRLYLGDEHKELEQLREFRAAIVRALAGGGLYCACMGIVHDDGCPIAQLEVEAEELRNP